MNNDQYLKYSIQDYFSKSIFVRKRFQQIENQEHINQK